jgi:hypothetical protein
MIGRSQDHKSIGKAILLFCLSLRPGYIGMLLYPRKTKCDQFRGMVAADT